MTYHYPFQKLAYAWQGRENCEILLVASGDSILAISVRDGQLLSRWPPQEHDDVTDHNSRSHEEIKNGEPPAKRRKINSSGYASDGSEDSIEIVAERKKGERRRPKVPTSKLPNVSHMVVTRDGQHMVAVTADDKSVKVFKLNPPGILMLLSERSLPKRLCAVKLTADEKTILTADKFGDVYSLPLHPSKDFVPRVSSPKPDVTYSPAATELTVHTKGNREALRQQLEQKKFKPRKEGPDFEHQLLLGHVSLLTDLTIAEGMVDGRSRPFILTADRDEHIRVSRGIPQAHIIENYCLGHREFISKLCIPSWAPEILVAGNGEPSLRLFRWQTGIQIEETDVFSAIPQGIKDEMLLDGRECGKIVVSGIWALNRSADDNHARVHHLLMVALEGVPALFVYLLNPNESLQHLDVLNLKGNTLDVTQMANGHVVVSIDVAHKPASVKNLRSLDDHQVMPLQFFKLVQNQDDLHGDDGSNTAFGSWKEVLFPNVEQLLENCPEIESATQATENRNKGQDKLYSELGEFLYGLENLRKKRGIAAEEEAAAEADDIDTAMAPNPNASG